MWYRVTWIILPFLFAEDQSIPQQISETRKLFIRRPHPYPIMHWGRGGQGIGPIPWCLGPKGWDPYPMMHWGRGWWVSIPWCIGARERDGDLPHDALGLVGGGGGLSYDSLRQEPPTPFLDRMTDTTKNINFPQPSDTYVNYDGTMAWNQFHWPIPQ